MPAYSSSAALLSDARLRSEALGQEAAILVVEGPDDKRLFTAHSEAPQQIIAAGGRRLLLSASQRAEDEDRTDVVFLVDCDYDVSLGQVKPGSKNLIITEHADVEADLVALGRVRGLVAELIPRALDSDEVLTEITQTVQRRAVAIAEPLGKIRLIARRSGFSIDPVIRNPGRHRITEEQVDVEKLTRTIAMNSPEAEMSPTELYEAVLNEPGGFEVCNGHDLVATLTHVIRTDFGVRDVDERTMARMLRHGVLERELASWSVVQRVQRWEEAGGRRVLRPWTMGV